MLEFINIQKIQLTHINNTKLQIQTLVQATSSFHKMWALPSLSPITLMLLKMIFL